MKLRHDDIPLEGYFCLGCGADLSQYPTSAAAHICRPHISEIVKNKFGANEKQETPLLEQKQALTGT